MTYFIENLLREYLEQYLPEDKFPTNLRNESELNAQNNGVLTKLRYSDLLQYLHLGQLVDLIKSKMFKKEKNNNVERVGINPLIIKRNTIMHSRLISWEQFDEIQEVCEKLVFALDDSEYVSRWNCFLTEEIEDYSVPMVFIEYPLGKNFEKLIGRKKELEDLKKLLRVPFPISIIRHGGLGKTALVLQLIEDLMYSPQQQFERIYFMSFKNSMFENGVVRRFEKVISNHNDLIYKLANCMDIATNGYSFEEIENAVWNDMFSKKSLLVLDNLETEVVRTNLSEFTAIADKFVQNFMCESRLIVTSRYGLGDRERKFPLYEFDLQNTKDLVTVNMIDQTEKLRNISKEDWDWVQEYSQGNPALIISFCHTFRSTLKSMIDLRIEYDSKYSSESRELHDNLDTFLEFCFENTIESMPRESQIFLSCVCYLCAEANISEISEEFLTFIIDELGLQKLGDQNLRATNLVNIGFLQPILGTDRYYVNDLVIEYIMVTMENQTMLLLLFLI
jgi:hypothetical protein